MAGQTKMIKFMNIQPVGNFCLIDVYDVRNSNDSYHLKLFAIKWLPYGNNKEIKKPKSCMLLLFKALQMYITLEYMIYTRRKIEFDCHHDWIRQSE